MLSDLELRKLARMIVEEQAENEQWMMNFAKAQSKLKEKERRLVSPEEAAKMIGISVWQLYHIKDDEHGNPRFSYVKSGESRSSRLKFDASVIVDEYSRFLASRKNKCVMLTTMKKVVGL